MPSRPALLTECLLTARFSLVRYDLLRTLTETIADGRGAQPNDDVLTATGAAPISFAAFAAKTARVWK